jgi:hypothetical protein
MNGSAWGGASGSILLQKVITENPHAVVLDLKSYQSYVSAVIQCDRDC